MTDPETGDVVGEDLRVLAELACFAAGFASREACEAVDADLDIPVLIPEVAAWVKAFAA